MPATTRTTREAGGAEQVADAATAGFGGDGGALGGTALLAQLALGLRHCGAPSGSGFECLRLANYARQEARDPAWSG